ncbi:hypothetical protein CDCA_CDCA03G1147 [Cyanidium caldarium]|uniref:COPI associated protein n=1 Tax=Cyanidium caldarium TaxID=2771 RepID=A0AAV9IS01_CYACA|nr:hypothetical protein CDCA_CDCA03G1147 [Cyanidium caldarium]
MKNCIFCEVNMERVAQVLRWLTVLAGGFLIFVGIWSLVTLFTAGANVLKNPLGFIVFLYVAFFGLLIILGELGWPRAMFRVFGFMVGRWGRSLFQAFTGSLAITGGVSDSDTVAKILLLVGGSVIVAFSFLNMCYGKRHTFDEDLDPTKAQPESSGRGWRFWKKSSRSGADNGPAAPQSSATAPPAAGMDIESDGTYRNPVASGQGYDRSGWLEGASEGVPRKGGGGRGDPNRAI